ncbi:MBOAT family protein [Entomospira entomophila]|uniref:MBOAT family O-acyltransferase n=1 Tax=Entomospira entomophila TaxID=2719988 RepID=UPI001BAFA83B|nr:MBOAT family O-acyltransferase [Entomospira entomophilus]WDI34988.1 MBOAT family protein [Entomospira entomophilus]
MNYTIGSFLRHYKNKSLLIIGITLNTASIVYYKYADFFLENINHLFKTNIPLLQLLLPLGISFFTFQQIAFLIDTYRNDIASTKNSFIDYALFITFFPQLIAGPIVSHKQILPQLVNLKVSKAVFSENMVKGLFAFSLGLFKKVAIADSLAIWVKHGFNQESLHFFEAWQTSLAYTLQLYFDFSGYSDMAIGLALFFNIILPHNFNSPYKATSIQDFWRRWHITLSHFLLTYLYIPLGGNRKGNIRTYLNLLITFTLGGLWHGAGWTFLLWGLLHGGALVIHRIWRQLGFHMHKIIGWMMTFSFVNFAWIFFRAETFTDAKKIIKGMIGLNGFGGLKPTIIDAITSIFIESIEPLGFITIPLSLLYIISGMAIALFTKNIQERLDHFIPSLKNLVLALFSFFWVYLVFIGGNVTPEFLYFNF